MSHDDAAKAAALAAMGITPPPANVINLAIADLIFSIIFLGVGGWVSWQHGKNGMVCFPLLLSAFAARIVADAYQLATKDELMIPNAVTTMTAAAVNACISLALIGLVYVSNCMLPSNTKYYKQYALLGVTHLVNTGGIAIATYFGAPSASSEDGVNNKQLNGIGNLMQVFVLLVVCGWMYPTWRQVQHYSKLAHPNAAPARVLLLGCGAAITFWLIRLAWLTTYAYDRLPTLDPVTGGFTVKLLLSFATYFLSSCIILAAGWFGVRRAAPGTVDEYGEECGQFVSHQSVELEMQRPYRKR